ncbi:HEXXH motif-containing putative peptide modification protein [Emcibacter sp. SYSU 3D8]|uniref:aKG-HExxH-type peptide beta-hydroxylase n=1 Tax=Emcibacter sp. SYSU 3D8 TaxID=3133969 RepID=UPI0031FEFE39
MAKAPLPEHLCARVVPGAVGAVHAFYRGRVLASLAALVESASRTIPGHQGLTARLPEDTSEALSPYLYYLNYRLLAAMKAGDRDAVSDLLDGFAAMPGAAFQAAGLTIDNLHDQPWHALMARDMVADDGDGAEVFAAAPARIKAARGPIVEALALVDRCHPAIAAEIRSLVCAITLFDGKVIGGSTDVRVFGNVFLRLPERGQDPVAYYADHLIHEAGHLYLNALMAHDPLILNDDSRTYPAPTRADPRPLFGILHATFILARLEAAFATIAAVAPDPYEAKLEAVRSQFAHGVATLRAHGKFTELGASLQQQFEALVDPRYARMAATV